jgi:hypothetical protein
MQTAIRRAYAIFYTNRDATRNGIPSAQIPFGPGSLGDPAATYIYR